MSLDHQAAEAIGERLEAVNDYYGAREEALEIAKANKDTSAPPYKPVPAISLYVTEPEWVSLLEELNARRLSPFEEPPALGVLSFGAKTGRNFGPERNNKEINVYDAGTGAC